MSLQCTAGHYGRRVFVCLREKLARLIEQVAKGFSMDKLGNPRQPSLGDVGLQRAENTNINRNPDVGWLICNRVNLFRIWCASRPYAIEGCAEANNNNLRLF